MNAPLLLTSVALLAAVAARPINPERGDDLREIVHSPSAHDDRQAFLRNAPSEESYNSFNSLQLHDIHDSNGPQPSDESFAGSASPRLRGSVPDPGLTSPYIGAQYRLSRTNGNELASPTLPSLSLEPLSPSASKSPSTLTEDVAETTPLALAAPDYSPRVVALVISSIASLALLGLAVAVVYVSHLFRSIVLKESVWRSVTRGKSRDKEGLETSEKEKITASDLKMLEAKIDDEKALIAPREVPPEFRSSHPTELGTTDEKATSSIEEEALIDDPEDVPLPEASVPAVRKNDDNRLGATIMAWTYDNWLTHFMVALFGWVGLILGGGRNN